MYSPKIIALLVTLVGVGLLDQPVAAQGHGMGGPARAGRIGGFGGGYGRAAFGRYARRHYYPGFAYYPFDDLYYEPPEREVVPVPVMRPPEPPAPPAKPVEALVLENRDGQWVRISAASPLPVSSEGVGRGASSSSGAKEKSEAPIKLPPPVLVFRDGHTEEVQRYVVQGDTLYASADYWTTGSWTRKIPVADLDIQASVKLNEARGGKFTLPARPYEVVIRF